MKEQDKIKQVLFRFEEAGLIARDIEGVLGCLSTKLLGIGIGEQGFVKSSEDVEKVYQNGLKEQSIASYSLEYNRIEILQYCDQFAVVCAEITVVSQNLNTSTTSKSKLLQSLTMVKEQDEWKICGLHASTPVVTEESLEAYPLKFAEKTLQSLREKIGEAAYQAEEQYRQAILADTVAFYIVNFTLDQFEKCQLNCDWCAQVEPGTPYEDYIIKMAPSYILEEDLPIFIQTFCKDMVNKAFLNNQKELSCEYRMKFHDAPNLWMLSIIRLITDNVTGHQKGILYVKNIDQSKREKLFMLNRATYDEMTNVYNKGMMKEYVSGQLVKTNGVFVMLDIDAFKLINDHYGHPVGDKVLIAVAQELKCFFKKTSFIGRMGGDEFAVFLPGERITNELKTEINELLQKINQIKIPDDQLIVITCSFGVAYSDKGMEFDGIYRKADELLYQSKNSGKNCISYQ